MWINDQDQRGSILEGFVYLTDLVSYYARVEKFYITRSSKAVLALQAKIVDIYVAILKYSLALKDTLEQGNICTTLTCYSINFTYQLV